MIITVLVGIVNQSAFSNVNGSTHKSVSYVPRSPSCLLTTCNDDHILASVCFHHTIMSWSATFKSCTRRKVQGRSLFCFTADVSHTYYRFSVCYRKIQERRLLDYKLWIPDVQLCPFSACLCYASFFCPRIELSNRLEHGILQFSMLKFIRFGIGQLSFCYKSKPF